jgi:hypothetical protein
LGVLLLQPNAKEPTKIKVTSDKEQYEDDGQLSVKLTDLNKTPISREIVNITIMNSKGKVVVDNVVKTNSKGNGILDLDLKKGKYIVNVTYGGNENYTGNNTTQKLTINEEEVVEEEPVIQESTESSSSSNDIYYDAKLNVYYDSNGVVVDPDGHHGQTVGSQYSDLLELQEKWERGEIEM